MIAEGAFDGGPVRPRVELIDGELREMCPTQEPHADMVSIVDEWSFENRPKDRVRVRIQSPICIPNGDSAPEPDVVLADRKDYRTTHPRPADIRLLIEVAESSLAYDCGEKADLYAGAGISDYWVVNIPERRVEVFRQPQNRRFTSHVVLVGQDEVHPLAFPEVTMQVEMLFPTA